MMAEASSSAWSLWPLVVTRLSQADDTRISETRTKCSLLHKTVASTGIAESQCSPLSHLLKDTQCEIAEELLTQLLDSTASTIKN